MITLIILASMQQFAEECKDLSPDAIRQKFENDTPVGIRDAMHGIGRLANPLSNNTFCSAMRCLGENYNIESLLKCQ